MTETIKQNNFLKWVNKQVDKLLSDDNPFERVSPEHMKGRSKYPMIPQRQTKRSAGFDIHLADSVYLKAGETKSTFTDIKCKLKDDEVLLIFIRSSIGTKRHISLANGTGVGDADYYGNPDNDGNIGLVLHNWGQDSQIFDVGDRVAQGVIVKYQAYGRPIRERIGGFGSSGK